MILKRVTASAVRTTQDDYKGVMQHLLGIARRDEAFWDGAARRGLLAMLDLLGENDERVRRCKSLLQQVLH